MSGRGESVYELLRLVRPIVLNSARVVEAEVRRHGWTAGSRAVMEVLVRDAPVTVPAIAAQLSLARQNVQRHVNELVDLGHVAITPNPAHRRSVLVQTTQQGRTAFEQVHRRELTDLDHMAAGCSRGELATAVKVLDALSRDISTRASEPTSTTQGESHGR